MNHTKVKGAKRRNFREIWKLVLEYCNDGNSHNTIQILTAVNSVGGHYIPILNELVEKGFLIKQKAKGHQYVYSTSLKGCKWLGVYEQLTALERTNSVVTCLTTE